MVSGLARCLTRDSQITELSAVVGILRTVGSTQLQHMVAPCYSYFSLQLARIARGAGVKLWLPLEYRAINLTIS